MKKIALLGYGKQNRSACEYYLKNFQAQLTICDQNEHLTDVPAGVETRLGADYLTNLAEFDLLVRTPFLHPQAIVAANGNDAIILEQVSSATNEFFRTVATPIIGVTGTKGKGTTCSVLQAILQQAGLQVVLAGNIGIPPLDVLEAAQAADVVILEIANFQAMDLRYSPQVGVCLPVMPEHLDWHADYQEYLTAKSQLFIHQQALDKAVYCLDNDASQRIVQSGAGQLISYTAINQATANISLRDGGIYIGQQLVAQTADSQLLGRHNHQNICAAVSAASTFLSTDQLASVTPTALQNCPALPAHLETVRIVNQVTYVDDSAASAPEATIAALEAIDASKILIVGGHDKGVSMQALVDKILTSNVKFVITIGATGIAIADLIQAQQADFPLNRTCTTMPDMVACATQAATAGDVVLLSPGCASFGLFKDYVDRSNQFQSAVANLN